MPTPNTPPQACFVCGKSFSKRELVSGVTVRESVADVIRREKPGWSSDSHICRADLQRFRQSYFQELLRSEKGELSSLEREVLESLHKHELLATNISEEIEERRTLGERLADRIAQFGGSWWFLTAFGSFMVLWIAMNAVVLHQRPFDPYPFILLNLLLSCLAAIQAPVIMMSQNRQEAKDRRRSEHDYQINLKAELEIRHLHEKLDHLLSRQWERLVQIQEMQIDLLNELARKK